MTRADLGTAPANVQIRKDDAAGWAALAERLETSGEQDSPGWWSRARRRKLSGSPA
ncbi:MULTISPECIES: hypothetical protein [Streptomyces griseus group]|uniref:hypothetical protein n=1 Tax=Streptomyces griseus group TaxID=629295 RepID=UPI0033BCED9F